MQQRRVSCLSCRTKKVKCDKKDPCKQCTKSNISTCVYPCQSTLGRPPKNAVFYGKSKNNDARKLAIREFIFENVGGQNNVNISHTNGNNNNNNDNSNMNESSKSDNKQLTLGNTNVIAIKEWWILSKEASQEHRHIYTYFQAIYQCYLQRGLAIRNRFNASPYCLPEKPRIKFNDLQLFFSWWMSMKVNMMIKRNSILQLDTNSATPLTVYMFYMVDSHGTTLKNGIRKRSGHQRRKKCKKDVATINSPLVPPLLFSSTTTVSSTTASASASTPSEFYQSVSAPFMPSIHLNHIYQHSPSDPLQSLPPEQAIHMIHDFFLVHPHSILINKTKLMKEYWSDTANPLLLSVIYGTTQCFSQILQGRPVSLWESGTEGNRNPFLTHAHSLLKNSSTLPSVNDYKATAILAIFEIMWGYSKLGMSLLSISYLMGAQLGLWDNTFMASDPVEAELMTMTFWATYKTTAFGCIELGVNMANPLVCGDRILPPMNIYESHSYQFDLLHNNTSDTNRRTFMIESFYSGAVVTHYSGILHACLPKAYFNLYGRKSHVPTFDNMDAISRLRAIDDVETRVYKVLDDFNSFIQQKRHKWTAIQRYTIETTYRLYRIHFRFLPPSLTSGPQKYQEDLVPNAAIENGVDLKFMVDISNPDAVSRIHQVRGDLLAMVDDLEEILMFYKNINNTNSSLSSSSRNQNSLLPHDIMVSAFETSARLLMLSYQMDASKHLHEAMKKLLVISHMQDKHQPPSTATKTLRHRLKSFLKRHPLAPTMTQQLKSNHVPITATLETNMHHLFYLHSPNTIQQSIQLHRQDYPPPPFILPATTMTVPHVNSLLSSASMPSDIDTNKNNNSYNDASSISNIITTNDTNISSMINTTADENIDWQRNDENQFRHHQPLDSMDPRLLDWCSLMTQTLYPSGFAAFLEQDQQQPGNLPR